MTRLRQRMLEDLRIRNYSPHTIDCYIRYVKFFARHFGKSPLRLGPEQTREYQRYLVEEKEVSWTVLNQTVCALRFLYRVTLGRDWIINHIPYPKQEKKLPVVLSREEVAAFISALPNHKHRTVFRTMYATGLRVSEALRLQIEDIDSKRMVVRVRRGKGRKDRYVPLSETLLKTLRTYWKVYQPASWLFPGKIPGKPLTHSSVQHLCGPVRKKVGIKKPVSPHSMRHAFATHLLEAGVDLRTIQLFLGHRSLNTTAVYLRIAVNAPQSSQSPFDLLGAMGNEAHAR